MFEINEKVEWTSQAGGNSKTKMGIVVGIVPERQSVLSIVRPVLNPGNISKSRKYKEGFDGGSYPRAHRSYIVLVESKSGNGKPTLYWPRVSMLKKLPL